LPDMPDRQQLIMTAIGPDRVGLVEKISEFISRRGGNIDDSKMAVFYGEFAVIVLIGGDDTSLEDISRDYQEIERDRAQNRVQDTPGEKSRGFSTLQTHRFLHGSPWRCVSDQRRAAQHGR
jgi:predicted amino acid-binding ACT domain protein